MPQHPSFQFETSNMLPVLDWGLDAPPVITEEEKKECCLTDSCKKDLMVEANLVFNLAKRIQMLLWLLVPAEFL